MNNRNTTIRNDNTSGIKGVIFKQDRNSWRAQWYDNEGKQRTKSFSIKKYGDQANNKQLLNVKKRNPSLDTYKIKIKLQQLYNDSSFQ